MAMMEFVLVLPFVWIIMVLIFNFGQSFLEQQRTRVAAREAGIRRAVARGELNDQVDPVRRDTLERRRLVGQFQDDDGGSCPRQDPFDSGRVDDALGRGLGMIGGAMDSLFGELSNTRIYTVSAEGPPVVSRLVTAPTYAVCFALDDSTWTYAETGGLESWFRNLLSF
jgi:hypothetical protein